MNNTPPPTPLTPIESLLADRAWIRSLARSLVRDESRADDLEQQAWVAALERPPADPSSPRGWFATVLRRAAGRDRRTDYRRDRRERVAARPEVAPATVDVVAQAEWHGRVVRAVLDLDEPYRTTLLLRYFEDLPPREVAARMGAPVETVRSRAQRGVALLRQRFDVVHGGERRAWAVPLLSLATGGRGRSGPGETGWEPAVPPAASGTAATAAAAGALGLLSRGAIGLAAALLVAGGLGRMAARRAEERAAASEAPGGARAAAASPSSVAAPPGLLAARPGRPAAAGGAGAPAQSAARLLGRVTRASDGSPVAGAIVTALLEAPLGRPPGAPLRTETDGEGRYALADLPPGEHVVWAEAPALATPGLSAWRDDGFNPCAVRVGGDVATTLDLALVAVGPVTGRVALPDGRPAVGARVEAALLPIGALILPAGQATPRWSAPCDASGAFRFDVLPAPARLTFVARAEGFAPRREAVALPSRVVSDSAFEIRFETPATVEVRVLDAESGAPVAGASIRAHAFGPTGYEEVEGATQATDDRGVASVGPLPPAGVRLEVVAAGHGAGCVDLTPDDLRDPARPASVVRLSRALPGAPVGAPALATDRRRLHVVGPDGRPVRIVNFLIVAPAADRRGVALCQGRLGGDAALTLPSGVGRWVEVFGAVGEDGAPLPLGTARVDLGASSGPIEVALPLARRVEGRVLDADGRALAGALVRALPSRWPLDLPRLRDAGGVGFARTGADGRFVLAQLSDEPYDLGVEGPEGTEPGALPAVLPGGAPLEVRLRAAPAR